MATWSRFLNQLVKDLNNLEDMAEGTFEDMVEREAENQASEGVRVTVSSSPIRDSENIFTNKRGKSKGNWEKIKGDVFTNLFPKGGAGGSGGGGGLADRVLHALSRNEARR